MIRGRHGAGARCWRLLATSSALLLVGCAHAGPKPETARLPHIDGTWLLAVDFKPIGAASYVQLLVTWEVTSHGATGSLAGDYQPLTTFGLAPDAPTRATVGTPWTTDAVAVDGAATFIAHLVGTLPGPANAMSGTEYSIDLTLHGTIRSTTSVCGTVTGTLGPIPDVTGSTFAAVPATMAALPAPIAACPTR